MSEYGWKRMPGTHKIMNLLMIGTGFLAMVAGLITALSQGLSIAISLALLLCLFLLHSSPIAVVSAFLWALIVANTPAVGVLSQDIGFNLVWAILGLFIGLVFIKSQSSEAISKNWLRVSRVEIIFLSFVLWNMLSVVYSIDKEASLRRAIGMLLSYIAFFRAIPVLLKAQTSRITMILAILPLLIGVTLTYLFLTSPPPLDLILQTDYQVQLLAHTGIQRWNAFGDPNGTGLLAALQIVLVFLVMRFSELRAWKVISLLTVPVAALIFLSSGSRSSYLLLGVCTLVLLFFSQVKRRFLGKVLFLVSIGLIVWALRSLVDAAPSFSTSFIAGWQDRIDVYEYVLVLWSHSPVGGYGAGTSFTVMRTGYWENIDNSYLIILLELGFIGLGLFVSYLIAVLIVGFRLLKQFPRHSRERTLVEGCVALSVGIMTTGIFQNSLAAQVTLFTQLFYLVSAALILLSQMPSSNTTKSISSDVPCIANVKYRY